jgi:hypothetical protein
MNLKKSEIAISQAQADVDRYQRDIQRYTLVKNEKDKAEEGEN